MSLNSWLYLKLGIAAKEMEMGRIGVEAEWQCESAPRTDMARIGRFEAIQSTLSSLYKGPAIAKLLHFYG